MSIVRYISDLHFGHKKICDFEGHNRGNSKTVDEHDEWVIAQWNSVVEKGDVTWVLGDVAFTSDGLKKMKRLNGIKNLVLGNHDKFSNDAYKIFFQKLYGFLKHEGFWLSHAPIHVDSLRGHRNIHGHLHSQIINDDRYICVSIENLKGLPKTIEQLVGTQ